MAAAPLYIGVVSHVGSKYAVNQGPEGLAELLRARIPHTSVEVLTDDLWDVESHPVTPAMVQATLSAELEVDRQWRAYLKQGKSPRWLITHGLRRLRRTQRRFVPPSPSMVLRLLNIEMSHRYLMEAGLASGAEWVLILEDDAGAESPDDLARGLLGIMADSQPVSFANLSRSFSIDELGINHLLLHEAGRSWEGRVTREVIPVRIPVTNTVCAILYRADFLRVLVATLASLPLEPVVPIDWKLNLALMDMNQRNTLIAPCIMVEPPPIDQLSMAGPEILPS